MRFFKTKRTNSSSSISMNGMKIEVRNGITYINGEKVRFSEDNELSSSEDKLYDVINLTITGDLIIEGDFKNSGTIDVGGDFNVKGNVLKNSGIIS